MKPFPCTLNPILNKSQWCLAPSLARKWLLSIILSAQEEICTHLTSGSITRSHSKKASKSGLLSDEHTLITSGISWHLGYLIRKTIPTQTPSRSSSPSRTSQRV